MSRIDPNLKKEPTGLPWMLVAFILVLLIPIEFSLRLGSILITPTRAFFLIAFFPVALATYRRGKFQFEDYMVVMFAIWVVIAVLVRRGADGIQLAGQQFLEIFVAYFLARTYLTTTRHIRQLAYGMSAVILVLGVLTIPESLSHSRFLHEIPRSLTGFYYEISNDTRYGMLRASSTFEHPILFGLFVSSLFTLLWFSARSTGVAIFRTVITAVATFFSLSSAALLVFGLQFMLILGERTTRWLPSRLPLLVSSITIVVLFLEMFSNRGSIKLIASYLTFSAHTAYYRIQQWNFTIDDVMRNPLFGLNMGGWTRPHWLTDSIDNHWLYTAFFFGIPATLMLWTLLGRTFFRVLKKVELSDGRPARPLHLSWSLGAVALFLGGWTVTFFGKMFSFFLFFIGIGVALSRMEEWEGATRNNEPTAVVSADPPENIGPRYTRFPAKPAVSKKQE